jgi:hypothetical protein
MNMEPENSLTTPPDPARAAEPEKQPDSHCPVCGAALIQEKCKVVCRSPRCTYRIVFNCSEF